MGAGGGHWRVFFRFVVQTLALAIVAGCSSHRDDGPSTPDASATAAPIAEHDDDARAIADAVRVALASQVALAERFAPNVDGFQSTRDGIVSPGWRGAWTDRAHHVGARLPRNADRSFEAGVGVSELYRLSLTHVGAKSATLAIDEGRGVYRDVYPSTDVTFVAAPERLEWAYTLRDEKAPSTFELRVKLPKHVRAAKLNGHGDVDFVDDSGDALLRVPRPLAIDAAGVTRGAPIEWDGEKLRVSLDRQGLAYPIVIDPAIETVVWQPRVVPPSARYEVTAAYDSARKRVVLFGGRENSNYFGDTWEFDGRVWTLRSTGGPSARSMHAMAYDSLRGVTVLFGGGNPGRNDIWEWDGTTWTQKCTSMPCSTSPMPQARNQAGMAFDVARGNTVLFGGYVNAITWLADTWTWNGSTWTSVPGSGPPVRYAHGMAYDTTGSRVLVFGGLNTSSISGGLNDLWAFNGTTWSSVTTTGGPPAGRGVAGFVFQNAVGKALLYGGYNSPGNKETWELTSATNTWNLVTSSSPPGSRFQFAMAYDSAREAAVVSGGYASGESSDTWEFKAGAWARPTGQLGDRRGAATAFDSWRNRIVMFGGDTAGNVQSNETWEWNGFEWEQQCTAAPCSTTLPSPTSSAAATFDSSRRVTVLVTGAQTWEYDGTAWTQMCTTSPCSGTKPSFRLWSALAYDSIRKTVVLFGGSGLQDTWEWNGSAWTPVCTTAPCSTTLPAGRSKHRMTFDSDRGRVIMFGGESSTGTRFGDTWEYTGSAWIQVATTGPDPRSASGLAYDSVRKKTVLFSGRPSSSADPSDTWEWNGTSWTRTATTGPAGRSTHVMQYDAARRRTVMSGGQNYLGVNYGDTWEYYTRGGACSIGTECATGFCNDGVCCEQVTCGACQACNTTGSPGVCAPVVSADDVDSCNPTTSSCDAAGVCRKRQGQTCTAATDCASGFCANGYCCDQACAGGCDVCNTTPGTCTKLAKGVTGSSPSCGAYLCDGVSGGCPATCATDGDCASTYFCAAGGVCQPRRAQGAACDLASGGDCMVSGCRECTGTLTCKDGYCCNSTCTSTCYTCAGTVKGACSQVLSAEDSDTCTGTKTCSSSGSCLSKNGETCTLGSQCASGSCVDGVCCNTACTGGCDVCNATAGTCTVVAQGTAGSGCGGYVCNGSSATCPTTCGNDADCASTYYCASSGTCQPRKAQGTTCNQAAGADCKSTGCRVCTTGNCIDGYCCNTACGDSCDACNGAALGWSGATNGTCAIAPASYAGSPACVAYACNGTSANCATGCTSDAQCASGHYCNAAGACVAQKTQGTSCNLATDCRVSGTCRACATGNCVDGYCCNTACGSQCQACDVSGAQGTCVTVTGAVHVNPAISARTACAGSGACASTCNGLDASKCTYPGSALSCGSASCMGGIATNIGTCNGSGGCNQTTTPCGAYGCGTTGTCKTSCGADSDCASSAYYCVGGACTPKKPNGEACTAANACVSGNCVDGVCCNVSACGTGERCNLVAALGKCAKANGVACTTSTDCGSGFCVDGVCCDSGCNSQCAACDVTGKIGTCSAVTGAPHGSRSACSGAGAGTECGPVCDGSDMIACHYPTGGKSCGANSCTVSGGTYIEKHTSVCDGAGACSDEPKTCVGYACGTTSCKTTCSANTDCATGFYCKTGACVPIEGLGTTCTTALTCTSGFCTDGVCCAVGSCGVGRSCSAGTGTLKGVCVSLNGTACSADAECASGVCADGVCCDTACNGSCEACNKSGSVGKCVPIVGNPLTGHPACTGTSTDSDCAARCDGTDGKSCKYPGTTASCGTPSCGGGIEKQVSTCDGAGTCKPASKTCSPYVCGPTACLASCTKNEDCGAGNYCKTGACVKVEGLGKACSAAAECSSGFCADGVCCATASCGEGSSCADALSTTPGTCLKKKGVACTKADECATGRCVDGLCCDLACNGQCEACDVTGSEGTCTPVVGAPHGVDRTACDTLDAKDCAKAQCDGKTRDKCAGFVNAGTTSCGMASCTTDKRFQAVGACDGAGKCAMPEPKNCTPYGCDAAASTGCKSTCATDDDCAADFKCEGGACIQGAKCSDDRSQSIDKAGVGKDCKPYRCGSDGKCATSCATSDDCAAGTTCDPNAKACVIFTVDDSGGDGGCGCATPGSSRSSARAALLLLALVVGYRRRRAGSRAHS